MIGRGFLIHKSYSSTEVYRFSFLLEELNAILEKTKGNNNKLATVEALHLQTTWEAIKEMLENEDLEERFYFYIERLKEKIENLLNI